MPHLQKLYETFRNRDDVQVITFNVDDDDSLAGPFVKRNRYTFPVLLAKRLWVEQFPMLGTPVTWIVDVNGVARVETWGFSGDGEKWTSQMVRTIEKLKAGTT